MHIILKKTTAIIAIVVMILSTSTTPANGGWHENHYDPNFLAGYGWSDPSDIRWWYEQYGSINYHGFVDAAAYAWGISSTPIRMDEVSELEDSNLRIYSWTYGNTNWLGIADGYSGYDYQQIRLNESYYGNYTASQWCKVASHEMGHAHGLAHY